MNYIIKTHIYQFCLKSSKIISSFISTKNFAQRIFRMLSPLKTNFFLFKELNFLKCNRFETVYLVFAAPFQSWDRLMIATWLERLGLSQYLGSLPSHISGSSLVSAGPHHLEKLLGMKNHLHRKKLILAMRSQLSSRPNPVDHIDHNWVIRWLDDIGLPQHKEAFSGLYTVFVS